MLGSANIEGSPLLHLMTGNLSHQIEHHLFPDMPSNRYAEVAPQVRDLCRRYGLPYHAGPMWKQYGGVLWKIARLSLPGGHATIEKRQRRALPAGRERRGHAAPAARSGCSGSPPDRCTPPAHRPGMR